MKTAIYFIIFTYLTSWILATAAFLLGLREASGPAYTLFGMIYMWIPAICAYILNKRSKEKPLRRVIISFRFNRWFYIAGAFPIIFTFLTLGINIFFPDVSFSISKLLLSDKTSQQEVFVIGYILKILLKAIFAGYTINAFFALGEELGWRGYLLEALKGGKFLPVSLFIGIVWGLWHWPLIAMGHNYPQHPILGIGMMVIWCILLSPVITYIVIKSKTVITAAIFHGTLNAVAGIASLFVIGGTDITNKVTGIAGFLALFILNIMVFFYDRFITKENIFINKVALFNSDEMLLKGKIGRKFKL
ncbi:MAG: CPBP family intramembrane metalloprotease [Rikenellaceae bacterium]|nr:CPBP family intramembrane metalloprotease [Rikenellaceae bacterium]